MSAKVTCGGGCGKQVFYKAGMSAAEPICRECRRAPDRLCLWCSQPYRSRRKEQTFCSMRCAGHAVAAEVAAS